MLGEKRNLSLFASQPAQEDKQVKHITVDRDGEKKDIPLYFGPDWPVVNGTGDTVPSPSDDPSSCQAEATAEKNRRNGSCRAYTAGYSRRYSRQLTGLRCAVSR